MCLKFRSVGLSVRVQSPDLCGFHKLGTTKRHNWELATHFCGLQGIIWPDLPVETSQRAKNYLPVLVIVLNSKTHAILRPPSRYIPLSSAISRYFHHTLISGASHPLVRALAELTPPDARIVHYKGAAWASATFTGMRHELRIECVGAQAIAAGKMLAARLPAHEFDLRGHVVADIFVARSVQTAQTLVLEIEALTVEDW